MQKLKTIAVRVSNSEHTNLKTTCAKRGTTIQSLVKKLLKPYLLRKK